MVSHGVGLFAEPATQGWDFAERGAMAVHDFNAQRLFIDQALAAAADVHCSLEQAHYLANVLRLGVGDEIRVFNGCDGEWLCRIVEIGRKSCILEAIERLRPQEGGPDIGYHFAPLKRARLDYMVQKATELGAARLVPVLTQHTIADRVNGERMRANVIEAAEQCGILRVPAVCEPIKFSSLIDRWSDDRWLVFCDEAAAVRSPLEALAPLDGMPTDILVGPEGGFSAAERERLLAHRRVVPISLGPRIMRADTAAIAALSLLNAVIGDWR